MALITAAHIGKTVAKRFPELGKQPGTIESLEASGDKVDSIQAQGLRTYTQPSGNLVYVKALQDHLMPGNNFISAGDPAKNVPADIVQVTDTDAKVLYSLGRGVLATDEEVAAAQKGVKK